MALGGVLLFATDQYQTLYHIHKTIRNRIICAFLHGMFNTWDSCLRNRYKQFWQILLIGCVFCDMADTCFALNVT